MRTCRFPTAQNTNGDDGIDFGAQSGALPEIKSGLGELDFWG
jgi:hypothetical protein